MIIIIFVNDSVPCCFIFLWLINMFFCTCIVLFVWQNLWADWWYNCNEKNHQILNCYCLELARNPNYPHLLTIFNDFFIIVTGAVVICVFFSVLNISNNLVHVYWLCNIYFRSICIILYHSILQFNYTNKVGLILTI